MIALFISEILAVNALIERQTRVLKEENEQLRAMAVGQGSQYGIIGESPALMNALNKAARATNTSVTVMLQGESGTGKERFSRMLHIDRTALSLPSTAQQFLQIYLNPNFLVMKKEPLLVLRMPSKAKWNWPITELCS